VVALIDIRTYVGIKSRGSVVGTVNTLRNGRSGVCNVAGQDILFFSLTSRPALGSMKIPFQWKPCFFPACKVAGVRIGPLTPFTADVKNEWKYTYILPLCSHVVDRDNFIVM